MGYRTEKTLKLESRLNNLEKENRNLKLQLEEHKNQTKKTNENMKHNIKLVEDRTREITNENIKTDDYIKDLTSELNDTFENIEIFTKATCENFVDVSNYNNAVSKKIKNIDKSIRFLSVAIMIVAIIQIVQNFS